MRSAVGWSEETKPDVVWNIGGTVIKVVAPAPMSDQERSARHEAVVQAVANCIRATQQKPTA